MTTEIVSFEQQYAALQSGRGFVELHSWSSVAVTGADRRAFLHNFCTNDVKRLNAGESCEAFFTNVKGKIVAHGLVTCRQDELVIIGVPGQAARLIEHLDRYIIREDVQLRDATDERRYALTAANVERIGPAFDVEQNGNAFPWGLIGGNGSVILESRPHSSQSVLLAFLQNGYVAVGQEAFTAARIEAGFPFCGIDFNEANLPQEVGRNRQAISFTKGCYLGQETVARIDAMGHVNQQLVGVRFFQDEVPHPGIEVFHQEKRAGVITSLAFSPRLNGPLALAMIRREANSPGTQLESPAGACEVVAFPVGTTNR